MKNIPLIYEDADYVLLNKPANMLSIPDRFDRSLPNLADALKKKFGQIWTIHRLDKGTSGIICFAKNEEAHQCLNQQFEQHRVHKIYLALVSGILQEKKGKIELSLSDNPAKAGTMKVDNKHGKPAITEYEVLEEFVHFSLIKVQLHTGRMHQIRIHFKAIGHPLAIDSLYGNRNEIFLSSFKSNYHPNATQEFPLMSRLTLHSFQLGFKHFRTHEYLLQEAPLPKDLGVLLKQLRKCTK